MKLYWQGKTPTNCDVCKTPITNVFYDARTRDGQWAIMCHSCQVSGPGMDKLGTGFGQRYQTDGDGKFVKTS